MGDESDARMVCLSAAAGTSHNPQRPMTKLTRFANGKVSNKALNLLANTAGMVATAIAITTSVAVFTPAANAYTTCSHNDFIGTTTCNGPGGTSYGSYDDFTGTSTWTSPGGSTTYCNHNSFINTTTCY